MNLYLSFNTGFRHTEWKFRSCFFVHETRQFFFSLAPHVIEGHAAFSVEQFARLSKLEPKSFWFKNRSKLKIWDLQKFLPAANRLSKLVSEHGLF